MADHLNREEASPLEMLTDQVVCPYVHVSVIRFASTNARDTRIRSGFTPYSTALCYQDENPLDNPIEKSRDTIASLAALLQTLSSVLASNSPHKLECEIGNAIELVRPHFWGPIRGESRLADLPQRTVMGIQNASLAPSVRRHHSPT